MKKRSWLAVVVGIAVVGVGIGRAQIDGNAPVAADASVPELIPYRGYIEQNGAPFTNDSPGVSMEFFIVDGPAKTFAQRLWSETQTVAVFGGYFAATLGSATPFTTLAAGVTGERLFNRHELYLGMRVAGAELQNKQRLLASPYAITARQAQNFRVEGNAAVGGTLSVTGMTALQTTTISGSLAANAGLTVTGGSTLNGATTVNSGVLTANSGVNVNGARVTANAGATVNSGLIVNGGETAYGGLNVQTGNLAVSNGHITRVSIDNWQGTTGGSISLGSFAYRFCALAKVRFHDNTGTAADRECNVTQDGVTWTLNALGPSLNCEAMCIQW